MMKKRARLGFDGFVREVVKGAVERSCVFGFLVVGLLCLAPLLSAAERPNLVFILADDWGWGDLSCHDHPYLKTPNIDRLAAEGLEFYQFTVASGVCSPSRAAIMTGQFPARHGIHGHFATVESHRKRQMPDWLDPQSVLLSRLLNESGYATAHYGKWHLTNIMVPDAPLPLEYGYDDYGAFNCSDPQMPVHEDVKRSITFIEKAVADRKPFFINLWIHEPHTPHYPKAAYLERFAHLESEADRVYAAVLAHADARIGELVSALERLNVADDTLVVFASDNGPENTGPASRRHQDDESTGPGLGSFASVGVTGGHRGRKRSLLQGGIGVPFIVRWPGKVPANRIDDVTPLTAVDLLPTFCAIAGARLPEGYQADGEDMTAALMGQPIRRRSKPIFWEWRFASNRGENWPAWAVRDGDWKFLSGKEAERLELFRFPTDRFEKDNLADGHSAEMDRLRSMLEGWISLLNSMIDPSLFSKTRSQ